MKTRYKYIHFEKDENDGYWDCRNNRSDDILGYVTLDDVWKEHIFAAYSSDMIFSAGCLDDISHFLKQLNSNPA